MDIWFVVGCIALAAILFGAFLVNRNRFESQNEAEAIAKRRIALTLSKGEVDHRPFVMLEWMEPETASSSRREFTIYRVENSETQFLHLANTRFQNFKDFSVQTGKTYHYWVVRSNPISNPEGLPSPIHSIEM